MSEFSGMSEAELRGYAQDNGIDLSGAVTTEEILNLIEAAPKPPKAPRVVEESTVEPEPEEPDSKSPGRGK